MPSAEEMTVQTSEDMKAQAAPEPTGPTAKEMAAAEEANALRRKQLAEREQALAEAAAQEPVPLVSLAAKGREALMEGLRQHALHKPPEYVPPPRTERQMTQLEAELEAGRRAQQRHAAQQASRPAPERNVNEGFTTPVHRPANMVPDPMTGKLGPISQ